MSGAEDPKPEAIVIDMVNAGRLIREGREARERRKAGANALVLDRVNGAPANDGSAAFTTAGEADPNLSKAEFPGGIDDMEL